MGKVQIVRAVIDTNVVISALLFGGIPGKLVDWWKTDRLIPLASNEIIDEYLRVLAYPKLKLSVEDINYIFYQEILPYFEVFKVGSGRTIVKKDPSDDKFIRCALSGKAKVIITGDSHLLSLKTYKEIKILTPSQFIKI